MTQDAVQKFGANARGAEYSFLPAVAYALEQFGNKNNKPIYALIALCNGKSVKGFTVVQEDGEPVKLTQYATPLRKVLKVSLPGVSFVFKDGNPKVKVKDNGGLNHDVLRNLQETLAFWNNKVSCRGDVFKKFIADHMPEGESNTSTPATKQKAIENLKKYVAKMKSDTGLSDADIMQILAPSLGEPDH